MSKHLVGAAARYTSRRNTTTATTAPNGRGRQETAWSFYSTIPEVRFAANWVGHSMSLARLYAGKRLPDGTVEPAPDTHPATEYVSGMCGGPAGRADLLRDFGPHLVVAGEGWIIISSEDGIERWRALSVLEVNPSTSGLDVEIDGVKVRIDDDDPAAPNAIRVWDPHPRRYIEADSPVLSALPVLDELRLLNASVKSIAKSRLTGRGVLLVPQGVRFPTKPGESDAEDDLIDVFMTVAETAIQDPESAAATVPIVLEVPADTIGDIKLLGFESPFDELAIKLREEAIRRFATGMEMPAEVIMGLADTNHWTAWSIEENGIRLAIEPRLALLCNAVTEWAMRPALEAAGVPDADEWLVWYDTSPLRVRTNRAQTALEVYDRGELSGVALRRETGFDDSDAPAPAQPGKTPSQRVSSPELPVDETNNPPTPPTGLSVDGLYAAADGLIWMALHRAGEKLRRTPACPRARRAEANQITAAALHTLLPVDETRVDQWGLLESAFDRAPEIAARYGTDPDCLHLSLDSYCRELLAAGVAHDFRHIPAALAGCVDV